MTVDLTCIDEHTCKSLRLQSLSMEWLVSRFSSSGIIVLSLQPGMLSIPESILLTSTTAMCKTQNIVVAPCDKVTSRLPRYVQTRLNMAIDT